MSKVEQNRQTQSGPKHCKKSSDLRNRLKAVSDVDKVALDSRLFHTLETVTGSARSPMMEWRIGATMSVNVDADLRRRRESMSTTLWSLSVRYGEVIESRQRYMSTASLNLIHCGTRSHCRPQSSGLMALYFLAEKTSMAAAFSTD